MHHFLLFKIHVVILSQSRHSCHKRKWGNVPKVHQLKFSNPITRVYPQFSKDFTECISALCVIFNTQTNSNLWSVYLEFNIHLRFSFSPDGYEVYIHVTVHRNRFLCNNQSEALIIQIYSVIKLYTFRASSVPIIRSFILYIRHW